MHQALSLVKREIGPDAVIVRTRTFKQGGILGLGARAMVEVTARQNDLSQPSTSRRKKNHAPFHRIYAASAGAPFLHQANCPLPIPPAPGGAARGEPAYLPFSEEIKHQITDLRSLVEALVKEQRQLHAPQMPEKLFDFYLNLIQREVADEIARDLIGKIQKDMSPEQANNAHYIRQKLAEVMDAMINAAGPIGRNINGAARVVAFVGPTGVGKTTTIAKLAADFKLRQNKKIGLITIDTYRIGAVDQLRMYAEIIGVPLKVVLTPGELSEAVMLMQDYDIVLIDTAGRSQNDQLRIQELQSFLAAAKPHEVHLVLSSTAHQSHLLSAAEKFNEIGIDRLIFTKLDEAISFGVVLSVMKKLQASLSYITTGQDVPDDIEVGSGRRLARLLLGMETLNNKTDLATLNVTTV